MKTFKIPIDIRFFYHRVRKFLKESFVYIFLFSKDVFNKKGAKADIRIAFNGYSSKNLHDAQEKDWFFNYIDKLTGKKLEVSWYKPSLIICSSFGSYWLLKLILKNANCPSLFFSEENLATLKKYREYRDYMNELPTLAMGFDYRSAGNYRRFPIWLEYIFPPLFALEASVQDIQAQLDEIEKRSFDPKKYFAAMIASHDGYCSPKKVNDCKVKFTRSEIAEALEKIDIVHCPGKLKHNDDSLMDVFADDKKAYLRQFVFNICAENASVPGYVTEKLFESLEAGAIPIYWGDRNPEPEILNPDRIIFWHEGDENGENIKKIQALYKSPKNRDLFFQEKIFMPQAAENIYNYFIVLRKDFKQLLNL